MLELKCKKYICHKSAHSILSNFINWFGGHGERDGVRGLISRFYTFGYRNPDNSFIPEDKHKVCYYDPVVRLTAGKFNYLIDDACIFCAVNIIVGSLFDRDSKPAHTRELMEETIRLIPIYHRQKVDCSTKYCQMCCLKRDLRMVLNDIPKNQPIKWTLLEEMAHRASKEEWGRGAVYNRMLSYTKKRDDVLNDWDNFEADFEWAIKPIYLDRET